MLSSERQPIFPEIFLKLPHKQNHNLFVELSKSLFDSLFSLKPNWKAKNHHTLNCRPSRKYGGYGLLLYYLFFKLYVKPRPKILGGNLKRKSNPKDCLWKSFEINLSFQLGWKHMINSFEFWYYLRSFQLGLNMNKNFEFQY